MLSGLIFVLISYYAISIALFVSAVFTTHDCSIRCTDCSTRRKSLCFIGSLRSSVSVPLVFWAVFSPGPQYNYSTSLPLNCSTPDISPALFSLSVSPFRHVPTAPLPAISVAIFGV
jgi:hypothetical protein